MGADEFLRNRDVLSTHDPQIELHTNLEERLPYWFMKRVDQISVKEFPNRCFRGKVQAKSK